MKNKNIILAVCILLLVSLSVIGCRTAQRPAEPRTTPAPDQEDMNRDGVTGDNNISGTDSGDNRMFTDNNRSADDRTITDNRTTMDGGATTGNMADRVNRIVREVEDIRDVRRAAVVITGNTALVGVDMTSGTKGELNSQIKRDVEDAVRRADRDITKVSVTADPDIFTRIENIARDVGEGRPLSGFGTEIEEIIRRITPGA